MIYELRRYTAAPGKTEALHNRFRTLTLGVFARYNMEVVGLLTVGFPAEVPPPPRRKTMAEIVHYNVYGNQAVDQQVKPGRLKAGPLGILLRRLRIKFRI